MLKSHFFTENEYRAKVLRWKPHHHKSASAVQRTYSVLCKEHFQSLTVPIWVRFRGGKHAHSKTRPCWLPFTSGNCSCSWQYLSNNFFQAPAATTDTLLEIAGLCRNHFSLSFQSSTDKYKNLRVNLFSRIGRGCRWCTFLQQRNKPSDRDEKIGLEIMQLLKK